MNPHHEVVLISWIKIYYKFVLLHPVCGAYK
jgi:hypothetical protein